MIDAVDTMRQDANRPGAAINDPGLDTEGGTSMRDQTTVIGNISDVAERFGVDGADVWEIIIRDITLTNPDGVRVGLVADPDERQGTMWIVREVPR